MKKILAAMLVCFAIMASASAADQCVPIRDKNGEIARSATQVNRFKKTHPCPSSGLTKGKCSGYVVDHIVPLCACGKDIPENMQWQTLADSKVKDKKELALCNSLKK